VKLEKPGEDDFQGIGRLDDSRIAECEGIDQTWPGFEAAEAAAANTPAANRPFGGIVGGWDIVLFKE